MHDFPMYQKLKEKRDLQKAQRTKSCSHNWKDNLKEEKWEHNEVKAYAHSQLHEQSHVQVYIN